MELTWPRVISGAFALSCAVALCVWTIRADRIEELKEQIEAYEASANLNLPETLKKLDTANLILSQRLSEVIELELLKPKLEAVESQNKALRLEISTLKESLADREKIINDIYLHKGKFRVWKGKTEHLGGHQFIIGVNYVNSAEHSAKMVLNNEQVELFVGALYTFRLNERRCTLAVDKADFDYEVADSYVDFSFFCPKPVQDQSNESSKGTQQRDAAERRYFLER